MNLEAMEELLAKKSLTRHDFEAKVRGRHMLSCMPWSCSECGPTAPFGVAALARGTPNLL